MRRLLIALFAFVSLSAQASDEVAFIPLKGGGNLFITSSPCPGGKFVYLTNGEGITKAAGCGVKQGDYLMVEVTPDGKEIRKYVYSIFDIQIMANGR